MKGVTEKAAGVESGGRREDPSFGSDSNRVATVPIGGLGGNHFQAHLLADGAREEAPDRMGLPVSCRHDFFQGGPAGLVQQIENLPGLAALTRAVGFVRPVARLSGTGGRSGKGLQLSDVGLRRGRGYRFAETLDSFPDPRNSCLRILELLYGSRAG